MIPAFRTGNWMHDELEGALCTTQHGSVLVLAKTGEMSDDAIEQLPKQEVNIRINQLICNHWAFIVS